MPADTTAQEAPMTDPIKMAQEVLGAIQLTGPDDDNAYWLCIAGDGQHTMVNQGDVRSQISGDLMSGWETKRRTALAALDAIPQPAADGPDAHDGCDHEGFPGGCIRAGHKPETCDQRPGPPPEHKIITGLREAIDHASAPVPGDAELDALANALRSGRQADMEGVMVTVSRQACEYAADALSALRTRLAEVEGALECFVGFDTLPAAAKRPDAFERMVRQPIMAAHRKLKEGK